MFKKYKDEVNEILKDNEFDFKLNAKASNIRTTYKGIEFIMWIDSKNFTCEAIRGTEVKQEYVKNCKELNDAAHYLISRIRIFVRPIVHIHTNKGIKKFLDTAYSESNQEDNKFNEYIFRSIIKFISGSNKNMHVSEKEAEEIAVAYMDQKVKKMKKSKEIENEKQQQK